MGPGGARELPGTLSPADGTASAGCRRGSVAAGMLVTVLAQTGLFRELAETGFQGQREERRSCLCFKGTGQEEPRHSKVLKERKHLLVREACASREWPEADGNSELSGETHTHIRQQSTESPGGGGTALPASGSQH